MEGSSISWEKNPAEDAALSLTRQLACLGPPGILIGITRQSFAFSNRESQFSGTTIAWVTGWT